MVMPYKLSFRFIYILDDGQYVGIALGLNGVSANYFLQFLLPRYDK